MQKNAHKQAMRQRSRTKEKLLMLEKTWRWFGPFDPIALSEVKQTGATGIVTALHQIPVGEIWTEADIMERKRTIEAAGFAWTVAESLPVSELIKLRSEGYQRHIENYKLSVRNLGKCGIDTVCYNFMPVLDWSRTDLEVPMTDGSVTTKFQSVAFAAFDLCILKRRNAERDYTRSGAESARTFYSSLHEKEKARLQRTILLGLPGSANSFSLEEFRAAISAYDRIDEAELRDNLSYFLGQIVPVAEESGVALAIHPDDPPWPLLGLPRIVSTKEDLRRILSSADTFFNGITLCAGSLGARSDNNVVDIAKSFASRLHFIHLRNVKRTADRDFFESHHLEGDVDIGGVMQVLVREQRRRAERGGLNHRMPIRPDHGRLMPADRILEKERGKSVYPGYSLIGRMKALAELRGIEIGVRRAMNF